MLISSFRTITLSGLLRSGFIHDHSAVSAPRICSSCHASLRVLRSPAFDVRVKCGLLTSIHSSAASTSAIASAATAMAPASATRDRGNGERNDKRADVMRLILPKLKRHVKLHPGASPPDPLHALSLAASPARSVRVGRFASLAPFVRSAVPRIGDKLELMGDTFELGVDTFGDITADDHGNLKSAALVLREVVEEGVLADQVGLAAIGVGEHHRRDFSIAAPEVVLAAIASRTTNILLGSAVTVLSTDDPVRVFERFSTLDALSHGRAEVILGRGSFTESYPLFGYDLARYEELFEDKLRLFAALLEPGPVTWSGTTRPAIEGLTMYPPTEHGRLRTWVGVGGSPESVVRAARYGFPLTLAIIGGNPQRFRPFVDLYRQALEKLGRPLLPIAVHSPGHVAATDEQARRELWPHYETMINRIGGERGWPPATHAQFEREAGPDGALCVGSPDTVAAKIAKTVRQLGLSRFNVKYSNGTLPHARLMTSIELLGTRVAPRVRELLVDHPAASGGNR
jgi:probable LLM family oxidoreductase